MILDPQNMGLDTLIVELCALLAEIWRNIHFPVMASLICIKMVCGTYCLLFNIANRFLWYFSDLETSIRNWFPGGARNPLLPTRLYTIFDKYKNNIKGTWSTIKSLLNRVRVKSEFPEYFMIENKLVSDKSTISNKFNEFYTNIGPNLAKEINIASS